MRLALHIFTLFTFLVATRAFTITSPGPAGWDKNVGRVTVTWKVDPGDPPTFSMLLRNLGPKSVVNSLAIANNVASGLSALTLDLPPVPLSKTYQLLFVDVADVNRHHIGDGDPEDVYNVVITTDTPWDVKRSPDFNHSPLQCHQSPTEYDYHSLEHDRCYFKSVRYHSGGNFGAIELDPDL